MALVICPDCGHEISEYANMWPNCGLPLQKFLKDNNITNIQGVLVCPKCASIYNGWNCKYDLPQNLKCEYCDSILVQTDEDTEEIFKLSCPKEKEPDDLLTILLVTLFFTYSTLDASIPIVYLPDFKSTYAPGSSDILLSISLMSITIV